MIWLIAILLLAIFAGLGYLRGSIQMGISVLGMFVALMLAVPLGPLMTPIYTASGVTNLILLAVLPPITAYVVVCLVFMTIGIVVHFKVRKFFHYKTDSATQTMWKRLNQRVGSAFGLIAGMVYSILIGVGIYSTGYLTYQVSTDSDPGWLKFITDTRVSMDGNGLGRMAATLDPMPAKYYEVADLIGLSHRNPLLENRYRNYPPFLKLSERGDIQEIADDTEFHGLLVQQSSLAEIMSHPLGQKVMSNAELADILINQTDLKDLQSYLNDGVSPTYEDQKLLGRWQLNGNMMINHTKRTTAGIKSRELIALKALVDNYLDGASLIVYTDDQFDLVAPEAPEKEEEQVEARPQQSEFDQRYGGLTRPGRGPGFGPGAGRPAPQPQKEPEPSVDISTSGSWEQAATGRFLMEGNGETMRANISKNRLLIKAAGMDLVFTRVY